MKSKRVAGSTPKDGVAARDPGLYAERMAALVQVQRTLVSLEATPEELMDRIPDMALSVVHASGALFELLDGDAMILKAGSPAVTSVDALGMRLLLDGSLSGEAIRLDRTLRCDDTEADPRVALQACRKFGSRSVLVTIVRDTAGPIGALKLFDEQPSRFGDAEAHSIELLAEALGAAIQRKRAEAETQRLLRNQASIVRLQQQVTLSQDDLQTRLELITASAQELTRAHGASIALVDGDDMVYRTACGIASASLGRRARREGSLGGLSLAGEEILCCSDSEIDPRVNREACRELGVRSLMIAPLRADGSVVGVFRVMSARTNAFAPVDAGTLQILAEWLGVVMQRNAIAEQLLASEAQYRVLFAAHPLPMWVYDVENLRFLAVNDAAIVEYGYSKDEFLAMTLRDIRPPGSVVMLDAYLAARGDQAAGHAVWQHLKKDGTLLDVEVSDNTISFGDRPARIVLVRDITEQKRAELRLEKSEGLLRIAGRATRVGGWSMDLVNMAFSWSDQLSAIHDLPAGTACTVEEALAFYAPESRAPMRRAVYALSRDGTPFDLELEIITATERRIEVRSIGEAVRDAAGTIIATQGAVQDISERKQAEAAARALAASLATTLKSITDGFYTLDRDWRFTYVNAEAERLIQRPRADLIGRVIWEAIPRLVGGDFHRQYHDAVARQVAITIESYYEPWQLWLEVHAYPSDAGLTVHFRDVSERRFAQAALRSLNQGLEAKVAERTLELERTNSALASKEEEIRSVVENMADGVITFADDGIVRSANPMIESIFGHAPSAIVGRDISVLIPALGGLAAAVGKAADSDLEETIAAVGREAYGSREGGDAIALDVAISAYHIRGQRVWTAIVRDIGERMRIMTALKEARYDAEEASRAKSAFVATMSHEIRTPMNGVIGMIDVLHQTPLAPDQARMLNVARDSAHALLAIIEDILDFSKIEAGRVELERLPFSVAGVAKNVCELVAGMAGGKGVELVVDIDPGLPGAVWGDAGRLRQVLVNLLSNAIKFSAGRPGARVSLQSRLSEQVADRVNVQWEIEDNGVGMEAATVDRLFVPFAQADASTTRRFGGTGLGLAISHHLVQLMGGYIDVRSTPGVGSVFTVRLPFFVAAAAPAIAPVDRPEPAPQASPAVAGQGQDPAATSRLVLVAEDHEMNRHVIAEQLKRLGYQAEIAEDGRQALLLWRSGRFGVLLTDLQMPEMDGYELTATIRTEEAGQTRIPIIALTANALKEEANRCKAAGMDGYLTKPVMMATLGQALKTAFEPPAAPDPAATDAEKRTRLISSDRGAQQREQSAGEPHDLERAPDVVA